MHPHLTRLNLFLYILTVEHEYIYIHGSLHTMFYHRPPNEFLSINSYDEFYSLVRTRSKNIGFVYGQQYVTRHQDNPQTLRLQTVLKFLVRY